MSEQNNKRPEPVEILIVEDSLTQAVQLQGLLEKAAYQTTIAMNGKEALDILKGDLPTMVISDIVMPKMDGYELCRKIKSDERTRDLPVILVTQLSQPEDILKGLKCGADNFITKPYDEHFLLCRLNHILLNRELRKKTRTDVGLEIYFADEKHFITSDRIQILDLLLSTYESALQKAKELERVNRELQAALDTIRQLQGILPICSACKKIRDEQGHWQPLEVYIGERSDTQFSHGLCPECARKLYPGYFSE